MRKIFTFLLFHLIFTIEYVIPQDEGAQVKPVSSEQVYQQEENIKPKNADIIPSGSLLNFKKAEPGKGFYGDVYIRYTGYSQNYFRIDKSDNSLWNGKHWDRSDYPLSIYIIKSYSKYFKEIFSDYVNYALEVWEESDSRLEFDIADSLHKADIIISFEKSLPDKYNENYLGLTDYEVDGNKRISRAIVEISLLKVNNVKISDGEIKSTIIHELGHALGLGHSSNKLDLMYPYINPRSSDKMHYIELSRGDIKAAQSIISLGFGRDISEN